MPPSQVVLDTLVDDVGGLARNPLGYVRYAYPWGEGELKGESPKKWQVGVLREIGEHLSNPETRFTPLLVAVSSGHGVGKSTLCAWVAQWGLSTCDDAKVVVTANTEPQLRTKTWPEMAKWVRLMINGFWFKLEETCLHSRALEHERTWRADRITWSEQNTEAFAGLHNKGKRIVLIFDEASSISDKIWEVAEGALTDENTEIIWLVFGNPTQPTGRFAECFGKFKHRWKTIQLDARTVEGTNKEQLKKWVEDYGEDSDFVRIRVRGEFPRAGSNQFISPDAVALCRKFVAEGYEDLGKIHAWDVARFGDDQTVGGCRQGRKAILFEKLRGKDTVFIAERVIHWIEKDDPDAVVIDGDGIGAGVIDQVKARGYSRKLHEFRGGLRANDPLSFYNRRAEVWSAMKEWIESLVEIPDDAELATDLTGPQYGYSAKNQIQLEKKEDMKTRGLSSPDIGDMLAMTFAVKVAPRRKSAQLHHAPQFIEIGAKYPSLAWMR